MYSRKKGMAFGMAKSAFSFPDVGISLNSKESNRMNF